MATLIISAPTLTAARRRGARWLFGSPMATAGIALVAILILAGVFAPLLAPFPPNGQTNLALHGASGTHLLGTDEFGRDVLSRILYGVRQDVLVAAVSVPIGAITGVGLGLLTGLSRWLDTILQRVFDVMLAFTALIAGVTVASIVGPGRNAVLITVAIVNIPLFGRITRTSVLSLRNRDYVVAARVIGARPGRVLVRHVLLNGVDPLIVQMALSLSMAVFIEGAMSFISLGVLLPEPSLGNMLQKSINYLHQNPWYAIGPMVVVTLLVVGFQLIADGLTHRLLRR
jgi:peptide/nickel transport system permease protein